MNFEFITNVRISKKYRIYFPLYVCGKEGEIGIAWGSLYCLFYYKITESYMTVVLVEYVKQSWSTHVLINCQRYIDDDVHLDLFILDAIFNYKEVVNYFKTTLFLFKKE